MTKHDTLVKLKPGNPYESILDLFSGGRIPMRDPFPMQRVKTTDGEKLVLWIVDLERLSSVQSIAIAQVIAHSYGADPTCVAAEAVRFGGFAMKHEWVDSMECGDEGIQRQKELADFFETGPQPPNAKTYREFCTSQRDRWIDGDEVPPHINSIEDVDPRLRTPELERALKMRKIEQAIGSGNYSVLDVLSGRAMTDVLNQIDPENSYSLVSDAEFEDDEIYE